MAFAGGGGFGGGNWGPGGGGGGYPGGGGWPGSGGGFPRGGTTGTWTQPTTTQGGGGAPAPPSTTRTVTTVVRPPTVPTTVVVTTTRAAPQNPNPNPNPAPNPTNAQTQTRVVTQTQTRVDVVTSRLPDGASTTYTQTRSPVLVTRTEIVESSAYATTTSTDANGSKTTITQFQVFTTRYGDGQQGPGSGGDDDDPAGAATGASRQAQIGTIVGAVVGSVVALLIFAIIGALLYRRRRRLDRGQRLASTTVSPVMAQRVLSPVQSVRSQATTPAIPPPALAPLRRQPSRSSHTSEDKVIGYTGDVEYGSESAQGSWTATAVPYVKPAPPPRLMIPDSELDEVDSLSSLPSPPYSGPLASGTTPATGREQRFTALGLPTPFSQTSFYTDYTPAFGPYAAEAVPPPYASNRASTANSVDPHRSSMKSTQ